MRNGKVFKRVHLSIVSDQGETVDVAISQNDNREPEGPSP